MSGIINILYELMSPEEAQALMLGPKAKQADLEKLEEFKASDPDYSFGKSLANVFGNFFPRNPTLWDLPYGAEQWYYENRRGKTPSFEISDLAADVNNNFKRKSTLGKVLTHNKLYDNYPDLKDVPVKVDRSLIGSSTQAYFSYDTNSINVNPELLKDKNAFKSSLLHEVQHAIDNKEDRLGRGAYGIFKNEDATAVLPEDLKYIYGPDYSYYILPTEQRARGVEQRLRAAETSSPQNPIYEDLAASQTIDWLRSEAKSSNKDYKGSDTDFKKAIKELYETGKTTYYGKELSTEYFEPYLMRALENTYKSQTKK